MTAPTIMNAEVKIASAYQAVLAAEAAGGNVSGLFARLNDAGKLLASARMSDRNGDFDVADLLAGLGENIGGSVQNEAVTLRASASIEASQHSLNTTLAFVGSLAAIALGSFGVWHILRRRYWNHHGWIVVGSLVLMLVSAIPVSAPYVRLPAGSERFSELWLLGPSHKADDCPFNVNVNNTYSVYVGVGNHLGHSAYYRMCVKLRNETQPLPVASNSTPSSLPELYEYDFFDPENQVWQEPLNFTFLDVEHLNDTVTVGSLLINDVTFRVNGTALWNVERKGFHYQLLFELWLYNTTSKSFQYHNRYVALWLNMTA